MNDITVVTTFHKAGMDLYGQRFLDSFSQRVDKKVKLLVYAEDCKPVNPDEKQITIFDARLALADLNAFKLQWRNDPKANGIPPAAIRERRPRDHHKAFKWDAIRFANKTYAVYDACRRSKDWCVWMDADTFVHSDWSFDQFKGCLPDKDWITYVGRGKGSQTWPECGFYGMNLNNHVCQEFLKEFERVYADAENGIFLLEEWHDSFVFGDIVNRMRESSPNVLDYSSEMYMKTAKTGGGGHPLINTKLGQWIDHMKGDRKHNGKSLPKDITVARNEGYWQ
jgi:hypothetical protein